MRTSSHLALGALLRGGINIGRRTRADAAHRRAAFEVSVLWQSEIVGGPQERRVRRESKTYPEVDAHHGPRSHGPKTEDERAAPGTRGVPVPLTRARDFSSESRLGHGHYVHSTRARIRVPNGDYGLVHETRSLVAPVEHARFKLLRRRAERSLRAIWNTRNLQYGPRC